MPFLDGGQGRIRRPAAVSLRGRVMRLACLALALHGSALLSGCATLAEGSAQTVLIETDPPGARCSLVRDGTVLTTIPETPATVSVYKHKGQLRLECRKKGYLPMTSNQGSRFEGMTLGNILFGGVIGVFVYAVSGAMHRYPDAIRVTLIPERFSSEAARDRFFDALREKILAAEAEAAARLEKTCQADDCQERLKKLHATSQARLDELERQRARAVVGPADADGAEIPATTGGYEQ